MAAPSIDGPPPLIGLDAVSRSFGPVRAVDAVSFDVRPGEVHALCGHNGAGKSTVVKLLFGLLQPDAGRVMIDGREVVLESPQRAQALGLALVDQELSVVPSLTVLDNLFLGRPGEPLFRRRGRERPRARALLAAVGLDHVEPGDFVEDLSLAERQLVEIARALGRDARVLFLDEPTATLSATEIEHVFAAVRRVVGTGRGVVFVSHRLGEVMALCDRVTVLRNGRNAGTRAVSELSVPALVEMMLGEPAQPAPRRARADAGRRAALRVAGLDVGAVTRGFGMTADGGVIHGLAGQVGCGAGDVLRALAGLAPEADGRVEVDGTPVALGTPVRSAAAGLAYLSNDRKGEGLFPGQSIAANLLATRLAALSRLGVIDRGAARAETRRLAATVGLDDARLDEPVMRLSGGNQQKVFLGRCLGRAETRALLLDEPTRGVDVRGRAEIHELLRAAARDGVVVVFASSELEEILDLADVVLTMRSGRVISRLEGDAIEARRILGDMTHAAGTAAA